MRKLSLAGLALASSALALLAVSAQAGAAKVQQDMVRHTSGAIWTLAMDGSRVAYMKNGRRVGVWNVVTGAASVVKGSYPSEGAHFGYGRGEVAIAGKRVALITRYEIGNTMQTQERLFMARVGGSAHQIRKVTNHESSGGDCEVPGSGGSFGSWVAGLVGSGNTLAVSTWSSDNATTSRERLRLIGPYGLREIATGPDAIAPQSVNHGHIAVLRTTESWPAYQGPLEQSSPMVGVYSTGGALLGQVTLDVLPEQCGYPSAYVRIALSGDRLVVLRLDTQQPRSVTATVDVYDWRTGTQVNSWPITLSHVSPVNDRLYTAGRIAVISGAFELRLLDLTTGKTATIDASRPNNPATIGSRGLVYALNPRKEKGHAKLVFVPRARLLSMLGS